MRGCFLLLLTVSACYSQIPTVITKYGPIQGTTYIVQEQQKVYEFLGVPFAEPPLGNLRFEKPQTPRPWTTPYNATSYPLACVQCVKPSWAISEDCLRLNIWTPSLTGQQLPVVVYIHGGAYQSGTGQQNAKAIREVYAVSGIVFISIQYRLGWMGFMTLNNTQLPANLGLWDQNMALKWVQDNVGRFGGNSKQVTIWGTSAGSSSVGQHTISPKSRGLFSQAYEQSGSPIAAFARGPFVIQATRTVLLKLGCPTQGDIKKCLQSKTIDQFYAVTGKCLPNDVDIVEYSPLFDGDFFTEDVEAAIKSSPALPTLVGLNQVEGRLFVLSNLFAFSIPAAEYQYMTADALYDLIETWISNRGYSGEAESAAKTIYDFYSQGYTNSSDHKFWVEQYVKLWTDTFFNAPAMREAIAKTNANAKVYTYRLDYYNQATWPVDSPCQGSTHVSEMPYCLGLNDNFQFNSDDWLVSNNMVAFIKSFIKTGNPGWKAFNPSTFNYYSLKQKPNEANGMFKDAYNFWTNTMRKYKFDFVTRQLWADLS